AAGGGRGGGFGAGGFAGGRGGRGAAPARTVRLPGEPEALTALANGDSDLAAAAKAVVAKLDWPGKPEPAATVPPLTAEERARFEAGSELYQNLCVACHQPDGRGRENLAPALAGSVLVNGNEGIPIRIVLGGKEGEIGLMPPLNALSDDQIAAVLTYIRREWGNTGTPVTAESVREIRGLTRTRTRPWTNDELLPAGRGGGAGRGGM